MAPDLLPAGPQLQLGLHHRNEQPPKRLTRRSLVRASVAAAAVGVIPFGTAARAQSDPPKRPPLTIETKLKDGVYQWSGRVSNRVPNAAPRATSFLSAAVNSPAARAFTGAKPFLRVFGRAAGIIGVANMAWDLADFALGIVSKVTAYDPERWRSVTTTQNQDGTAPGNTPEVLVNFRRLPTGFPYPEPQPGDPVRVIYNNPLAYDYVSQPIVAFAQLTADVRIPSTSVFAVLTQETASNATRPEPTLTTAQRYGLSESLTFHKQWVYAGGPIPQGLRVTVIQYRVIGEVPAPNQTWDDVRNVLANLGLRTFNGAGIADTMNELFRNSGDPELFNAVSQTPFVGADFANITTADAMAEVPDIFEVDQDQPVITPVDPNPGTGLGPIDWGVFNPPGFELPALEIPEVPTAQEIIDTLTNPLSALIPVQNTGPVACPSFPWLMGQQVSAHCPAVELAQPWMGNASKIAAQIAAFFIALRE